MNAFECHAKLIEAIAAQNPRAAGHAAAAFLKLLKGGDDFVFAPIDPSPMRAKGRVHGLVAVVGAINQYAARSVP